MVYVYRSDQAQSLEPLFHNGITLLIFSAPWCGTCRAVKRAINEFDPQGKVAFLEIDVDRFKELVDRFKVQGVPMLILLHDGMVLDRKGGSLDYTEFTAWYDSHEILRLSK